METYPNSVTQVLLRQQLQVVHTENVGDAKAVKRLGLFQPLHTVSTCVLYFLYLQLVTYDL